MHTDTTQLGILAFLLAALAGAAGTATIVAALVLKKYDVARLVALLGALGAGGYVSVLLLAAFTTGETVLGPGEEKHFCEVRTAAADAVHTDVAYHLLRGFLRIVAVRDKVEFNIADAPRNLLERDLRTPDMVGKV